jgi:Fic family protein
VNILLNLSRRPVKKMFSPNYSIDFDIKYTLDEIDRTKYRIERLIMPKYEKWLRREAFIRTAYSSTMVEDGTITEEELENAAKPSPAASIPEYRKEVVNYGKALEFVDYLSEMSDVSVPLSMEGTIRQLHWHLMREVHDIHVKPGQYRNEPNWIIDQGIKVYYPPSHIDLPILMREFSDWLQEEHGDIPAVIIAGIAHIHLVAVHPFIDGNGRTARLLATLLLQKSGYGFNNLLSIDAYYQRNRGEYVKALHASTGERYTEGYNSNEWLKFFTTSILVQAQILEEKLTDWNMNVDKIHHNWQKYGFNDRQIDGLIYAVNTGIITRKDYIEIASVSAVTASKELADMVKRGLLYPEGMGRSRKYRIVIDKNSETQERL